MKIFDAITFYNEVDLLQTRINYLEKDITAFIIVEGDTTFTGHPKPLYLERVQPGYNRLINKMCELPDGDAWDKEIAQRNYIAEVLSTFDSEAWVIISDVDEFPNMEVVKNISESSLPVQLDVKQYFWNIHWQVPDHCNEGGRPVVAKIRHLKDSSPQELRSSLNIQRVPNGGWHFSFFNKKELISKKIESFAHTEYNQEEYKNLEAITWRIKYGIDPFDRFPLKWVEHDSQVSNIFKEEVI